MLGLLLTILLSPATAFSQQSTLVEGIVTDEQSGDPLPGVQLILQSSRKGGVTGLDGRFEIKNVSQGDDVIIVRFVGYETIERPIAVSLGQNLTLSFALKIQPIQLGGIAVSATRERQSISDIAASIGSVDGNTIADVNPSHPSQIMGKIPGVWVNSTSGEGHMTSIRQPLSTSPLYLYLENGVPTRSTGFFNHNALYEINIPQADGIEVIKGPGTALYGSDAIGGVINVSSGKVPARSQYGATIEGGSYGFKRALLSGGTTRGMNGIRLDLNLSDSEGWRNNTAYQRQSATLRWERRIGSTSLLKTVFAWSNIDQEPAGASAISEEDFKADARTNYTPISYRTVKSFRASSAYERYYSSSLLSITPFVRFSSMDLLPNWALTFDPAIWEAQNVSIGAQLKWRKDIDAYRTRIVLGSDLDLSPGERREYSIDPTKEGKIYTSYVEGDDQYNYDVTYRQASPFVHAELSPVPKVRLNAGLRLDVMGYSYTNNLSEVSTGRHRRPGSDSRSYTHLSPKLGFTFQATERLNAFASYRHAFRVPSERQLFRQGSSSNTIDLDPVKVDSYEAGIRGQLSEQTSFELTAFSMQKKDDIVAFVFEDGTRGSVNAGETSHRGIETGLSIAPVTGLSLSTAYTLAVHEYEKWETQLGEDLSGNEMEVAPRTILNAEAAYSLPLLSGFSIALEWNRLGSYWTDSKNSTKYDGHDVFNLRTSLKVTESVTILGRVGNLTDVLYAERVTHNAFRGDEFAPGAPRTVNISIRYGL